MAAKTSEAALHRKIAAECFNKAWDYLEMEDRTPRDDREMLAMAHASRFHWGLVGTSENQAVGDWQLSRVYAALGEARLSLEFAKACLDTCGKSHLDGIVHTANEAMARAYAVAGDRRAARKHIVLARKQLDALTLEDEDREVYLDQIRRTERTIRSRKGARVRIS